MSVTLSSSTTVQTTGAEITTSQQTEKSQTPPGLPPIVDAGPNVQESLGASVELQNFLRSSAEIGNMTSAEVNGKTIYSAVIGRNEQVKNNVSALTITSHPDGSFDLTRTSNDNPPKVTTTFHSIHSSDFKNAVTNTIDLLEDLVELNH
jgi:hypothetical protein